MLKYSSIHQHPLFQINKNITFTCALSNRAKSLLFSVFIHLNFFTTAANSHSFTLVMQLVLLHLSLMLEQRVRAWADSSVAAKGTQHGLVSQVRAIPTAFRQKPTQQLRFDRFFRFGSAIFFCLAALILALYIEKRWWRAFFRDFVVPAVVDEGCIFPDYYAKWSKASVQTLIGRNLYLRMDCSFEVLLKLDEKAPQIGAAISVFNVLSNSVDLRLRFLYLPFSLFAVLTETRTPRSIGGGETQHSLRPSRSER